MTRLCTPFSIIRQRCPRWVDPKCTRHPRNTRHASWASRSEARPPTKPDNRHSGGGRQSVKRIARGRFRRQNSPDPEPEQNTKSRPESNDHLKTTSYRHAVQSAAEKDDYSLRFLRSSEAYNEAVPQAEQRGSPDSRQPKYVEKLRGYDGYTLAATRLRLPESTGSNYDRREMLRHMTQDVAANITKYEEGTLVPFSRPEYAYAAHEALLDCVNMSSQTYRNAASGTLEAFRQVSQDLTNIVARSPNVELYRRRRKVNQTFRMLSQDRFDFNILTREVRDLTKVTHAIISRDILFWEHVTRLAAFKTSFHTVISGWSEIKRIASDVRFSRRVTALMPSYRLTQYRSEVSKAKFEVKMILDSRLRHMNLPLFHLKKAVDFYHELLRVTSSIVAVLEELRGLYHTRMRRGDLAYRGKWIWIASWTKRTNIETLEISAVYRALAFYVSAHVRAKYDYQPVDGARRHHAPSELPDYVRYGLELQRHRDKQGPLPLPKIRPNIYGQFIDLPLIDTAYYDEFVDTSQVEVVEKTPNSLRSIRGGTAMDDVLDADVLPLDVVDTANSWDDSDFPRAEDISFSTSHDRLSNLRYGGMLERRKQMFNVAQADPVDEEILASTGSSIAAYAALYREQGSYARGQNLRSTSPVVTERRLLSPELVKPWQQSFQQRSRSRPNNYGALLQRFQGLAMGHEATHPTIDIIRASPPPMKDSKTRIVVDATIAEQTEATQNALQSDEETAIDVFAPTLGRGNTLLTQETFLDSMVDTVLQREALEHNALRRSGMLRLDLSRASNDPDQYATSNVPKDANSSRDSHHDSVLDTGLKKEQQELPARLKRSTTIVVPVDNSEFNEDIAKTKRDDFAILAKRASLSQTLFEEAIRRESSGRRRTNPRKSVVGILQRNAQWWRSRLEQEQDWQRYPDDTNYLATIQCNFESWERKLEEYNKVNGPGPASVAVAPGQVMSIEDKIDLTNLQQASTQSHTWFERAMRKGSRGQVARTIKRNIEFWQTKLSLEQLTMKHNNVPAYLATMQENLQLWQQKYDEHSQISGILRLPSKAVDNRAGIGPIDPAQRHEVVLEARVDSPSPLRVQIDNLREQIDGLQRIKLELERMHELEESQHHRDISFDDAKQYMSLDTSEEPTSSAEVLVTPQEPPDALLESPPRQTWSCPRCGTQIDIQRRSCPDCGQWPAGFKRSQVDEVTEESSNLVDGASGDPSEPPSYRKIDSDHSISCPRCFFGNQPTRSMCDQCGTALKASKIQRVLLEQDRQQQITQDIAVDALAEEVGPNLMAEFEQELARRKQDLKALEGEDRGAK